MTEQETALWSMVYAAELNRGHADGLTLEGAETRSAMVATAAVRYLRREASQLDSEVRRATKEDAGRSGPLCYVTEALKLAEERPAPVGGLNVFGDAAAALDSLTFHETLDALKNAPFRPFGEERRRVGRDAMEVLLQEAAASLISVKVCELRSKRRT